MNQQEIIDKIRVAIILAHRYRELLLELNPFNKILFSFEMDCILLFQRVIVNYICFKTKDQTIIYGEELASELNNFKSLANFNKGYLRLISQIIHYSI